jgi:DNA-binding NarL/FixJ family response regulator
MAPSSVVCPGQRAAERAGDPARILVADHDDAFRKLVGRLLMHEGYVVEQAADVDEALERLSAGSFDLLVADVDRQGNEGLVLLHAQQVVPVLLVTREPRLETAVAALRGAAVDYLVKPLAPAQFLSRVAEGIARSRALRRLGDLQEHLGAQLELVGNLRAALTIRGVAAAKMGAEARVPASVAELLSPRECEVLLAFRTTPRATEVASRLHISLHTVKNHMKAIFRKLEVGSQAELLARIERAEREVG